VPNPKPPANRARESATNDDGDEESGRRDTSGRRLTPGADRRR
jgi:hypothetical protein